jgi:hypothetical protein
MEGENKMVGKIGRFSVIALFLVVAVGFTSKSFAAKPGVEPVPYQIGEVQCGQTVTIYENSSQGNLIVTVTVSDFCTGLDSRLTGIHEGTSTPRDVTVPDGNTITTSFWISQHVGNKIELECLGDSGKGFCIYKIEVIR